jgi:hypothetical protein
MEFSMKILCYAVLITLSGMSPTLASESTDNDILASRGQGVVTQQQFSARADRIPASIRRETLRSATRLQDILNTMLLKSQLANAAREAGFDKDPIVQARMQLAADSELGEAWMNHYVDSQPEADYEAMAKEYYELNKAQFVSKPEVDVSHILISNEDRSMEEAMAIANEIELLLEEDPSSFDALVLQYSEDPSAQQNMGHFKGVKQGDMVKPFETAAFALEKGEISEPVQTRFGLHIIRLDESTPSRPLSYEEAKTEIITAQLSSHKERLRDAYLTELSQIDVNMTEEALEVMVSRQTGDE